MKFIPEQNGEMQQIIISVLTVAHLESINVLKSLKSCTNIYLFS